MATSKAASNKTSRGKAVPCTCAVKFGDDVGKPCPKCRCSGLSKCRHCKAVRERSSRVATDFDKRVHGARDAMELKAVLESEQERQKAALDVELARAGAPSSAQAKRPTGSRPADDVTSNTLVATSEQKTGHVAKVYQRAIGGTYFWRLFFDDGEPCMGPPYGTTLDAEYIGIAMGQAREWLGLVGMAWTVHVRTTESSGGIDWDTARALHGVELPEQKDGF